MNTLIINGSPLGQNGNTEIFIRRFIEGTGQDYLVRYAAKESAETLAQAAVQADILLIFMPLYVYAMPGIVMKLLERMVPAKKGQKIGFVVQAGFIEGAQARFLVSYLNAFAERMGYENLGVITKGDAAATRFLPIFMNRKLFKRLRLLGAHYARHGLFHKKTAELLAGMYEIPPQKARLYEFLHRTGINNMIWHKFWRKNGVFAQGLDRPFAPIISNSIRESLANVE